MALRDVCLAVTASQLLAEIGALYHQLHARPDFNRSVCTSPETIALEDQIRSLSDRYKRLTERRTTNDDEQDARVDHSQYQAASP